MPTTTTPQARVWNDISLSTLTAGFVAVTIGYTSSAAIIFQAAAASGASEAQISSWLWALGIGTGITSFGLSLRYRMPLLTAWSTPGAAFLATSLPGVPLEEAIGAFLFSAFLITLCGITGLFERLMRHIPGAIAAAMLAGILLRFGLELFGAMQTQWLMPLVMLAAWVIGRRLWPTLAVPGVLLAGLGVALFQGQIDLQGIPLAPTTPVFMAPAFSLSTLIGVGIPLFVITMATQNLPGVAVLRAAGYQPNSSPLIGWTGGVTLMLAPFGGFALNMAAISAAVCLGPDAHADPRRRYTAGMAAGVFYLIMVWCNGHRRIQRAAQRTGDCPGRHCPAEHISWRVRQRLCTPPAARCGDCHLPADRFRHHASGYRRAILGAGRRPDHA